ncbi:HAD-like domain-containing protein [Obelidium mucronatum]|nr:HAD-like domain-containing protein [Obelidium mucronatum]
MISVRSEEIKKMPIKLITFDAFNTLFRLKQPVASIYIAQLHQHCRSDPPPALDADKVASAFRHAFKRNSTLSPNFGAATAGGYQLWWQQVVNETFHLAGLETKYIIQKDATNMTVSQRIFNHFETAEPFELNPSAIRVLKSAKGDRERNCITGIISNSDARTERVVEALGLLGDTNNNSNGSKRDGSLVDFIITSNSVGYEKPDPRIFQIALERASKAIAAAAVAGGGGGGSGSSGLKLSGENALHIGDDRVRDFQGAKACGWNAVLLEDWNMLHQTFERGLDR